MKPGLSQIHGLGITVILLLLLTYLGISYADIQETHDAEVVEAVQISLQTSVSKGMAALQLPPSEIHPSNIINAARSTFPKGVSMDKHYHLVIDRSRREAQYEVSEAGDTFISGLKNFTRFHIEKGRIVRNNHWTMQLPSQLTQP